MSGVFCEVYGDTMRNRVLEYLLTHQHLGVAVGDMAKEIGISRPKAYEVMKELLSKGYVLPHRIVGKTQLYIINKDDAIVKIYMRNFKECLKMVISEHSEKPTEIRKTRVEAL